MVIVPSPVCAFPEGDRRERSRRPVEDNEQLLELYTISKLSNNAKNI